MGNVEKDMNRVKDLSLNELINLTQNFLKLADKMYQDGKLNEAEYTELTFIKKNFLEQAEKSHTL